ncbi:GNAT family N-acetyltransferase [Clostridium sp. MSJ-11]|uniref:GNAT family N-acetyltransferase n=1 Tax=Clostridium mobile TaxID=2841512 RepID=A0ABS6EGW6_9CLOT|nr:N-acetyltransferase [Clostridium mobile]MBU5484446.1 GNAT family N-acetyltransferase [Clostridium mobile]
MGYSIERLSDLESKYLEGVTKVFGECFGHMFKGFTEDIDLLATSFGNSFVKDKCYVYLEGDEVIGFVSCSSLDGRAMKIDKEPFQKNFGKIKGKIFAWQIEKIMCKVLVKSNREGYIDFLGVSSRQQRKGIGETLMRYIHQNEDYDKFILEVLASNLNAKKLYEKVGYKAIKEEKNIFMTLGGQGTAFIMEYIKE